MCWELQTNYSESRLIQSLWKEKKLTNQMLILSKSSTHKKVFDCVNLISLTDCDNINTDHIKPHLQ